MELAKAQAKFICFLLFVEGSLPQDGAKMETLLKEAVEIISKRPE